VQLSGAEDESGMRGRRLVSTPPVALLGAWLALAAVGCGREQPTSDDVVERIVLVSIDTLRADHLGCYGAEDAETPAIDGLAAEGVRFATAISPAPITLPSHASLLSGRDPPDHGVRHNGVFRLADDVPTLAEPLGAAGFATAAFVSAFVLDPRFGLARGFDVYDAEVGMKKQSSDHSVPERRGDHTVDAALRWLEDAPDRFFLWVHLYDPHASYEAPDPFGQRFATRPYDGEIAFADAQFGRLRTALEERWPRGTLWWLTSDHGEGLGEHGERTQTLGVYESTQHVPLIVAGPGVPRGEVQRGVVALADVAPTLLAQVGLGPLPGADGRNLIATLRDGTPSDRRAAWVETLSTQLDMGLSPLLGVRTDSHKYVRAPEPELYDLASDPRELENRIDEEPALAAELDALVEERAEGRPILLSFTPDAEERAQLEALGYVRSAGPAESDIALGVVGGIDPKRASDEIEKVDQVMALLQARRGKEALALYDELSLRSSMVRLLGAQAALQAGDPVRAEREAREALAMAANAEAFVRLGTAELHQGRHLDAKRSLEQAIALEPEAAAPYLALGWIDEREGRVADAVRRYEFVRSLPIPSPEAFWRLAAFALEDGRVDEARGLLAEVPQAELRVPDAAHRLAMAERRAGRSALARTRVEGSLREYPWAPHLWMLKAELLDEAGDLDAALAARRAALELSPGAAEVENAIAFTLARLGRDLDEAERHVEAALADRGRAPALHDTLATDRAAQGDSAEALALSEERLANAADVARIDLLDRRAEALAGLGRRDDAEQALALALSEAGAQGGPPNTWPDAERRVRSLLAPAS
jgi:arylsulfatase A-like enzyme/Tfp pilus assembly protein PilF